MTDDSDVARIARGLTKAQREYVSEGPHLHWTLTRRAIERRHLAYPLCSTEAVSVRGTLTPLGLRVKSYLQSKGGEA